MNMKKIEMNMTFLKQWIHSIDIMPGDRVMALLPGGGNAQYATAHEDHLIPVPDHLTFQQAAAIPEVWLTAFQLLFFVGKLNRLQLLS